MNQHFEEILYRLEETGALTFEKEKSLASCSTFHIGGKAEYAVYPRSAEGLREVIQAVRRTNIDYHVVGAGSDILFPDKGLSGAVIFTGALRDLVIEDDQIRAGAGVPLSILASKACTAGLSGGEGLFGIPGSVGGAVYMNAGAYDYTVSDILVSSSWYDPVKDIFGSYRKEEHEFDYRHSAYMGDRKIITGAVFSFKKDTSSAIKARMDNFISRRKSKQPLEYPSAGSVFKRYPGYFTGKLIEDAGLKGCTVGGAQVSEKHAGFIINIGNATAEDVKKLVDHIEQTVFEKYGIHIERELIYF